MEKDAEVKDMYKPVDRDKASDIRPEAPLPGEEIEPPPRDIPKGGLRPPDDLDAITMIPMGPDEPMPIIAPPEAPTRLTD